MRIPDDAKIRIAVKSKEELLEQTIPPFKDDVRKFIDTVESRSDVQFIETNE